VVVNRDSSQDTRVSIAGLKMANARALRLLAPSSDSETGVTFGGASVDSNGRWTAQKREPVQDGIVAVPRMSAAVIRVDR